MGEGAGEGDYGSSAEMVRRASGKLQCRMERCVLAGDEYMRVYRWSAKYKLVSFFIA